MEIVRGTDGHYTMIRVALDEFDGELILCRQE